MSDLTLHLWKMRGGGIPWACRRNIDVVTHIQLTGFDFTVTLYLYNLCDRKYEGIYKVMIQCHNGIICSFLN